MAQILSFGIDQGFLEKRARILASHGFHVSSVSQKDEALRLARMTPPEIVIFGHRVPESLRSSLARSIKKINPEVQMIYIYLGGSEGMGRADAVLNLESEPEALADTINYLLGRSKTTNIGA